jgi:flagellar motor protein MotB
MSAPESERPILIVKRRKKAGSAHHGGAWKVAYADFVTAMMAFFMVMWLIASVSKEERAAIFDYFKNPSMEQGKSPRASMGQMGRRQHQRHQSARRTRCAQVRHRAVYRSGYAARHADHGGQGGAGCGYGQEDRRGG